MEGENMKLSWLFTLLCMLVLLALLPSTSHANDLARFCIEPPEITVRPGERFTMSVTIYNIENMMGFLTELHYVPSVITAEDVQWSSFVEDNFTSQFSPIGPTIDNEFGMILLGFLATRPYPGGYPSGSGELAVLTLVGRSEGQTLLSPEGLTVWHDAPEPPIYPIAARNARITVEPYRVYIPFVSRHP
jgi:hypothetical protein